MYFLVIIALIINNVIGQNSRLEKLFENCKKSSPDFDDCVREGLNNARVFFKSGVPEYQIGPFDPFHADQVLQIRENDIFTYRLALKNITESGWTLSQVTRFKSNFNNYLIQYTQAFPAKELHGFYDIEGKLLGIQFQNKGKFDLYLYDLTQTTTITRKPIKYENNTWNYNTRLKVMVNVQSIGNMKLNLRNLYSNRPVTDYVLDSILSSTWKTGFPFFRPIINDLVSTAFTDIMNKNFKTFPFDKMFKD